MSRPAFLILWFAVLILGLALRVAHLDLRPMHHDEANQAVKFGTLLEEGEYRYDPKEHHGPTLYYLTLPAAWARGQDTLASLDERTLRAVPAVFGVGLIILMVYLARPLGRDAVLLAALFAALSPAMTYYSRFYIQESLFAFFSLGFLVSLGRTAVRPTLARTLTAGVFAGLALATKETSVLVFAAAAVALALTRLWMSRVQPTVFFPGDRRDRLRSAAIHVLAATGAAALVAAVLYSSFLRNPAGILEPVYALPGYAARAAGPSYHVHPWYYYLQILGYQNAGGVIWTEGVILVAALCAVAFALRRRAGRRASARYDIIQSTLAGQQFWPRFLALYTFFAAALFSILPYKTPWNLLAFHIGLVPLAGIGAAALLRLSGRRLLRGFLWVALLAALFQLGVQNWRANILYAADPRCPYVYAQTSPDFLRLSRRAHDLAAAHPDGKDMLVKVIAGPYEQWPMPWYLRDFRRVGYWTGPEGAGGFEGVSVVIASQENAAKLAGILGDRFQVEFYGLRPDVLLTMYIDRTLWERYLHRRI